MPLKKAAAALANKSDEIVKLTGVANTLVRTDNGLEAFNTDVYGISQSLAACFQLGVREVVILGAGATAISALVSTSASAPEASITVYARDVSRTQEIQHIAGILGLKIKVSTFNDITLRNDLLISTLPQGVLAEFAGSEASGWLLNTNYSSNEDSFAAAYNQDQVVGGRAMLLWQALAQIRIFLNGSADVALPNEALVFETMSNAL